MVNFYYGSVVTQFNLSEHGNIVKYDLPLNFSLFSFSNVKKRLDKKAKVNFKIHDFMYWETNNLSTHIAQYLKK